MVFSLPAYHGGHRRHRFHLLQQALILQVPFFNFICVKCIQKRRFHRNLRHRLHSPLNSKKYLSPSFCYVSFTKDPLSQPIWSSGPAIFKAREMKEIIVVPRFLCLSLSYYYHRHREFFNHVHDRGRDHVLLCHDHRGLHDLLGPSPFVPCSWAWVRHRLTGCREGGSRGG